MRRSDLGLLTLRLTAGLGLATHGLPKLAGGPEKQPPAWLVRLLGNNYVQYWQHSGPAGFAKGLESMGVPMPELAARASGVAELGGGLALAAGVATPLASVVVLANMTVAIARAHWKVGFSGQGGFELAYMFAAAALAVGVAGPGAISVDRLLGGRG